MNPPLSRESTDYDGGWKEGLEPFFGPFLQLCFPGVHAQVDWTKPVIFLDKELVDLLREAALGKQFVDKLAQVTLKRATHRYPAPPGGAKSVEPGVPRTVLPIPLPHTGQTRIAGGELGGLGR